MSKSESLTDIIQFQQKLCISALCSSLKLSFGSYYHPSPGLIIHGTPSTTMVMRGLTLKVPSLRNPADLMPHLCASVTIGLIGICMAHHIFLSTAGYVLVVWNRDRHRSLVGVVAVGVSPTTRRSAPASPLWSSGQRWPSEWARCLPAWSGLPQTCVWPPQHQHYS